MAALPWWSKDASISAVNSLQDRYRARGLRDEDCNRVVEDEDIEYISSHLCQKWRPLRSLLGMPRVMEQDIDQDHSKEEEKRRTFFFEWRDREGSEATYRRLIGALLEIGCREDAEGVCQLLLGKVDPKLETDGGVAFPVHKESSGEYDGVWLSSENPLPKF